MQITAEIFTALQVDGQGGRSFRQADGVDQSSGRQSLQQQVKVRVIAEALVKDGSKQVNRLDLRPGLPKRSRSFLGLVQAGLSPLLQLRGVICEA